MGTQDKVLILDELNRRHLDFVDDVKALARGLESDQWNWHEAPGEWSLAQILIHLELTGQNYASAIDNALSGTVFEQESHVSSSWFGSRLDALMRPKNGTVVKKVKAPRVLSPSAELSSGSAQLEKLFALENCFLRQIDEARQLKIRNLKVPFTLIKLLKVPIVDVWRFIASHNERHLLQMQKVKIRMQRRE